MASNNLNLHVFLAIFLTSSIHAHNLFSSSGFSVNLIHRDSPLSPYFNSSVPTSTLMRNALPRSISRAKNFNSSKKFQIPVFHGDLEYLVKLSFGTPPFEITAIADTGSELIWTQCKPCNPCYNQTDPIFDPQLSSTYKDFHCQDSATSTCLSIYGGYCFGSQCLYGIEYVDQSHTNGTIASETVTLGSTNDNSSQPISFPGIVFGCGHQNEGTFGQLESGIIGLGYDYPSLIYQLKPFIQGKFSHCLAPNPSVTSKISFGNNDLLIGDDVVSTPLHLTNHSYLLELQAISVGEKRLEYKVSKPELKDNGNTVIDLGTTYTLLPTVFYPELDLAVKEAIKLKPEKDPQGGFSLCYKGKDFLADAPKITLHFAEADLELTILNTFVALEDDLFCFVIRPFDVSDGMAIFGNIAQQNFLVGYDIEGGKLSFKPYDCSKQ
ncbi:aspartic proteinase CDR1-like [Quillaja saponaria]|uniref:Aspartic proteinase CDR1-like n=1 Tax=Quillaja saponaria TaxID=32244 RepID=A0AAD7LL89_QUISA|nr:aspartic proteinase CDR1-like [Quillaja saponaria]